MSVSYLSQIVLEHYIMSCCCFTRLTVGERKATWSEVISYDWRSIFINAAVGILITAFSTLSKIFLYSEGTKVLCFLFFWVCFFFISVQSCFLFQICHVATVHRQTISPRWAASWRLQTREEEKSWYISSGNTLLIASCAPLLSIGADGNWTSHAAHQWVRQSTIATFECFCSGFTLLCFISDARLILVEEFELFKVMVGPHFGRPKQTDPRPKVTA